MKVFSARNTRCFTAVSQTSILFTTLCFGQSGGSSAHLYRSPEHNGRADWTEFHRENMVRWNPYEHTLNVHNVGRLGFKWNYGSGDNNSIIDSSPAVSGGIVYFAFHSPWYGVVALNAETGVPLWSVITASTISSPAVADGIVYIGTEAFGVYALDAITGSVLWNYKLADKVDSSPAVANGVVYVGCDDGYVYALNALTGVLVWKFNTYGLVNSSPAVADGVVYVGSYDGDVLAIDAKTGAWLWNQVIGSNVNSSPAVAHGMVYIGADSLLCALDAKTGVIPWEVDFGSGTIQSTPAVSNLALDNSGTSIYVGNTDGHMYGISTQDGFEKWSFSTVAVRSSPAVANGVVYFGAGDGTVYALNAINGTKLWSYNTGNSAVNSSPAVVDGVVYIGSENGYIYAFGLRNGRK